MVEFAKLLSNGILKLHFTNQPLSKFWINVQNACHTCKRSSEKTFVFCNNRVFTLCVNKTKCKSRLDAEVDMYIQLYSQLSRVVCRSGYVYSTILSGITSDIKSISASLQAHPLN